MPHALVVEDDEGLRAYLAAVLVHHGLDVLSAGSGEEAFELLGGLPVKVAIGTDLPEIGNSIASHLQGEGDINVGDSVGSTLTQYSAANPGSDVAATQLPGYVNLTEGELNTFGLERLGGAEVNRKAPIGPCRCCWK